MHDIAAAAKPPRLRRLLYAVQIIGLLIYAVFLANHVSGSAGGADSAGYLIGAKLLANGTLTAPVRTIGDPQADHWTGFLYRPLGLVERDQTTLVPTYPLGFPLMIAAPGRIMGFDTAAAILLVIHALAGVVLTAVLGRLLGLPPGLAGFGAFMLAVCPLTIMFSVSLMTDMVATTWSLATVTAAVLGRKYDRWFLVAGLCFGVSVLVRNTNLILGLALLPLLGWNLRPWIYFAAGGFPAAAFLLTTNAFMYGGPLRSGYGDVSDLFRWRNIPPSLRNYEQFLPVLLSPLILIALLTPFVLRRQALTAAVLTLWSLAFLGFYAPYYHTRETWWYLRFVLPAFPALIIGALLTVQNLTSRPKVRGWIERHTIIATLAAIAAAALVVVNAYRANDNLKPGLAGLHELRYPQSFRVADQWIPGNAVVLTMQSSGAIYFYRPWAVVRYDSIGGNDEARVVELAARASRPIFAILHDFEMPEFIKHMRSMDDWEALGQYEGRTFYRYQPKAVSP